MPARGDEVYWWRTRLAPLLALVSQAAGLAAVRQHQLPRGDYGYANLLGPIDLVVVLLDAAFHFRKRKPQKYEQAGRLINEGL